jgi:protein-tyrosine phosphatase
VVNVRLAGTQEGAVAREFGLDYLALPIPPDAAPSPADLDQLVAFLRSHEQSSDVVYVHDDVGGGRVVSLAAMLLMLRGDPLNSVLATLSADELRHMSAGQWAALYALEAALRDPADPRGASYRRSRGLRW